MIIFSDFESDLSNNMFNEKFLKDYKSKLYYHLQELLIKNRLAVFYLMNMRTREEIGTRERHGVSLSRIAFVIRKKLKWMRLQKKFLGPFPPETKEEKK